MINLYVCIVIAFSHYSDIGLKMPSFSEPEVRSWESTWRLFYLNIMGKLIVKNRYGTIPNDLLNSTKISFKAKGLFAYIQSKPDNWEFSAERISKQVKEGLL